MPAEAPRKEPISVVELIDVTEIGAPLGYKCRIAMTPSLADRIDVAAALTRFHNLLFMTMKDRAFDVLRDVALHGKLARLTRGISLDSMQRFIERARAGLGGISDTGRLVALSVDSKAGSLLVLFHVPPIPSVAGVHREAALTISEVPQTDPALGWELIPW